MAAEVSGVTFHDLRGTAVLRLFLAGGTEAEIATITGHSLRDVRSILDSHYFCRDVGIGAIGDHEIGNREGQEQARTVNELCKMSCKMLKLLNISAV